MPTTTVPTTLLIAQSTVASSSNSAGLSGTDLGILALYLIVTIVWGAWPRKGSGSAEGYLLGGRSVAWPALMMSIVATETSTVTFLSLPGQTFKEGGNMTFLQITLGYIIGRLVVAAIMLPEYFRGSFFTAYEVLQSRFGGSVRRAASLVFLVCRTLADGLRLLLTALALQHALGWDFTSCVVVIAAATGIYATLGGVTSVVKNDCVQLIIYTLGALVAVGLIIRAVPGGATEILRFGEETGRLTVFDWGHGFTDGYINFWAGLIGGGILSLATHGVDHLMVQRYLCAGTQRKAALALCVSGPVVALQFLLFLLIGLGLACFYQQADVAYTIAKPDEAFAAFLAHETPVGLCGLLLAAIMAAAMSTLSSSVNASAGVLVKDIVEPATGELSPKQSIWLLRGATLLFTALQAGVALGAYQVGLEQSVIGAVLAIAGFAFGILLGLFALGLFCGKVGEIPGLAAIAVGFIAGWIIVGWGSDWETISWPLAEARMKIHSLSGIDLGWKPIHWTWNALIALTSTFATGYILHLLIPPSEKQA